MGKKKNVSLPHASKSWHQMWQQIHTSIHPFDFLIWVHIYCNCLILYNFSGLWWNQIYQYCLKRRKMKGWTTSLWIPAQWDQLKENQLTQFKLTKINSFFKEKNFAACLSLFYLPQSSNIPIANIITTITYWRKKRNCSQFYALDVSLLYKKSFIGKKYQPTHTLCGAIFPRPPPYLFRSLEHKITKAPNFFYLPPFQKQH